MIGIAQHNLPMQMVPAKTLAISDAILFRRFSTNENNFAIIFSYFARSNPLIKDGFWLLPECGTLCTVLFSIEKMNNGAESASEREKGGSISYPKQRIFKVFKSLLK